MKLILILLLPLAMACKKDPPLSYCEEFPDDCVDVREVKDYFYFNYGSWWVYEEENSGMRDSVYVTETYSDESSVIFETWMHSTYDGYDYTFWTTGVNGSVVTDNIAKKAERSTRVNRAKTKPGDYVAEATCFLFYPVSGLWTYSYGLQFGYDNILRIEDVHSSFVVLGTTYGNVVNISEEHTAIEEAQPTNHYYSPNIGLVKKELIDSNQVWNLVDYHIEN